MGNTYKIVVAKRERKTERKNLVELVINGRKVLKWILEK
jgi:hypothetical protein